MEVEEQSSRPLPSQAVYSERWDQITSLRGRLSHFSLLSLKDIILREDYCGNAASRVESYLMKTHYLFETEKTEGEEDSGRTIIVKRMDLLFNAKECQVLTFTDITMYKQLKQEAEKSRLLSTLNTSVHHEMLGPLKANIEFSERLIRSLKSATFRSIA